jgi:predicted AAA+ superfamily ATPase
LENWVFHELSAATAYAETPVQLAYWRLASGIEVDFIVDAMRVAIEAKASARVTSDHLKGLRELAVDHPQIGRRVVVCLEPKRRRTDEGIEILPVRDFVDELASGALLGSS